MTEDVTNSIKIQNTLEHDVKIYDSFSAEGEHNYFGELTLLATVQSKTTQAITLIHSSISTLIAFDTDGNPLERYVYVALDSLPSEDTDTDTDTTLSYQNNFVISPQNLVAIRQTEKFLDYITANSNSDLAVQFQALFNNDSGTLHIDAVDAFFQKTADYKDCTYSSYMLVLTHKAQAPISTSQPIEERVYRLSILGSYLGGKPWPPELPDIEVKRIKCSNNDGVLKLGGLIDLVNLPYKNSWTGTNILSLFSVDRKATQVDADVDVKFIYQLGLNFLSTEITFSREKFYIYVEHGRSITISNPTISIQIDPLFKFFVFTALATIPFNIFGHQFNTTISMVIDNVEAEIGAVIEGDHNALPSPPLLKGVHFDQFSVGMGIIFEPSSYALGLEGKFHIGEGETIVELDDETFALVCALEGDVPNPMYISFYIPKLDLSKLVEIFTDTAIAIDFPVSFSDLSFKWSENPMEPLVLPDGSLTQMEFGFSGYLDLFGLQFYGDLEIDLEGVEGIITMSPLYFGNLLKITGDGKAITIKVDENGNPIKNNQIAKTKVMKDAIAKAMPKQIIAAGGPKMSISTSTSPYFSLDAKVSLFELVNEKIDAQIANDGIHFELDYGAIIESKMKCTLTDYHNFSGDFYSGINQTIALPTINGFSLGSIPLQVIFDLNIAISTSTSDINFLVKGGFDFAGSRLSFGPYSVDINISTIRALIEAIANYILEHAEEIFKEFINAASPWATYVKNTVIQGVSDVAKGIKIAFDLAAPEAASVMNSVGYRIDEAALEIKNAYELSASELGNALVTGYNASAQSVASAFKYTGFSTAEIALGLNGVFGASPSDIKDILQEVGYGTNEIKDAFDTLGGEFTDFASQAWETIEKVFDTSKWPW